jgi:hypothetical protein
MKPFPIYMILVSLLITAVFVTACGTDKDDDKDYSSGEKYSWETDIAAIVVSDCSSSGCHGTTLPRSTVYENDAAALKAAKTEVIARLSLDVSNVSYMPKDSKTFSAEKKEKLIGFLNQ